MTALTLDLVLTMVSSAAMGHAGGLTLPCTSFQVLQMPKITHTSHKQLLGSRKRPSRAALAMAGTDRAIGLLHGHPVYFDSADGYQVDVDGRRRPVPSWLHIRRVGDVQVEGAAGLPQISASTQVVYPASDEAVGLFQGRPAHVDEKGGFIVNVDGEWRPVRKDDWPDVHQVHRLGHDQHTRRAAGQCESHIPRRQHIHSAWAVSLPGGETRHRCLPGHGRHCKVQKDAF
mmetsp:Transcript_16826/g.47931  ORF Transcript_16826/g.47931 Transcript_16826/m.47931 type:complete len:230 (+) Transcript_16826:278-967(+)